MSDRVPLPNISGLLSGFVSVDLFAGHFAGAARLVGFQPAVTDPPSGGSVTVELRTATGGGGQGLSATIPDGARTPATPVTGSIDIAAGTNLYLRVTAASGAALGLYGQFLVVDGTTSASALTSLARVKDYTDTTTTDDDAILSQLIAAVSLRMQNVMRRRIVLETIVGQRYSAGGGAPELCLRSFPVSETGLSVSLSGNALLAADFDLDSACGILFYTPGGSDPQPWPSGTRHISVGYEAGYASVPEDIQHAATIQCVWEMKRTESRGGRLGERTQLVGDNQTTFLVDAWAPDVIPVLDLYRMRSA